MRGFLVVVLLLSLRGAPAGAAAPDLTLSPGDSGPQVAAWQHLLNTYLGSVRRPAPVLEDGIFGPDTARATRRFERRAGTSPDGVVTTEDRILWLGGYLTSGWKGDPPLAIGLTDPRVGHLQVALDVWIPREQPGLSPLWIDTIFGPRTEQAVRAFQVSAGLAPDGVVGPRTWNALGDEELLRFPPI